MAKGGARFGAGRPALKVKGEQLQRVDVREWARRGLLKQWGSFTWSWNRGGEPAGCIGVSVLPERAVNLTYTFGAADGRREVDQRIELTCRPCNFGGLRPWFQCPRCDRQVAVLYLRFGRFACRHCQRVAYSSQSEDVMARTWREQLRMETRLGDNWQRPKGMRQRTYERLTNRLVDCEQRREDAFCVAAARLLGDKYADLLIG